MWRCSACSRRTASGPAPAPDPVAVDPAEQRGIRRKVVVCGYPADPGQHNMGPLRGASGAYKAKRISPGEVTHLLDDRPYRGPNRPTIYHDCSTLHGSSGSPLIDLASGEVWAIHYYGRDGVANYAEPMWAVMRDEQVGRHLEVGAAAAPDRPGPPGAIVPRGTEIVQRMDLRPTNDDFLKGYLTGQGPEGVPGFMGMDSRSYGELEESIPSVGFLSSDGITRTTCFLVAPDLVLTTFDIGMLREDMEEGPLWVDFNRTVQRGPISTTPFPGRRVPRHGGRLLDTTGFSVDGDGAVRFEAGVQSYPVKRLKLARMKPNSPPKSPCIRWGIRSGTHGSPRKSSMSFSPRPSASSACHGGH